MAIPPLELDPAAWALFLDVDGTLLELQPRPEQVCADDELSNLLKSLLEQLGGAMALISGRGIADIDRIFAPNEFSAAGGHGAEYRLAGKTHKVHGFPTIPKVTLQRREALTKQYSGLLLEPKRHGIAMHYRGAPEAKQAVFQWIQEECAQLSEAFCILTGKMVYELVPAKVNKGTALKELLGCEPFFHRKPIFVGDDVTDEPGFAVANDYGGLSIGVGQHSPSPATLRLNGVFAVRDWLSKAFIK